MGRGEQGGRGRANRGYRKPLTGFGLPVGKEKMRPSGLLELLVEDRFYSVNRSSSFSYVCNACGRCCRDKVIVLSPFDLLRIAREGGGCDIRGDFARFTIRRGSILKFRDDGACVALDGVRCGVASGDVRLYGRLYPLGIERDSRAR